MDIAGWISLIASIVSLVLAIVAIVFSFLMDKKADESHKATIDALHQLKIVSAQIQEVVSENHQKMVTAILRKVDEPGETERRLLMLADLMKSKNMSADETEKIARIAADSAKPERMPEQIASIMNAFVSAAPQLQQLLGVFGNATTENLTAAPSAAAPRPQSRPPQP